MLYKLPCYMDIGKKRISLNLNWYRNAHHQTLSRAKREFAPISGEWFQAKKIRIKYTLFLGTNRRTDGMNWIAVVDKFFADWLVNNGRIPDDCWKHYTGGAWDVVREGKETYVQAEISIVQ